MTEVPEGMDPDAAAHWPSQALIESWLGDFDFELRPGEDTPVPSDDPEAVAAARRFRDVLGRFATGVTVVTSMSDGEPVGMTCQSFSSVSLTPPLVLFCPAKTSRAWPRIQRSGKFCVNLLAHDQAQVSNLMAAKGVDKFASVSWTPSSATGSPLLEGTLGYVDCTIQTVHEAGDHFIVVGQVQDLATTEAPHPLLFFRGSYSRPQDGPAE
ncbi:flavin reductase family protein [Nocardioides terrisoli]|uniref:flavin reductase family protein n=1 Tax=Nocardioides terrisoli TaxID=3388267 RepID=UPI00287B9340|nr:flavin reductase family protein [Nocardioides marmorisolisilvae]